MCLNIFILWFPPNVSLNKFHPVAISEEWTVKYVYQHNTDKVMHDSLADWKVLTDEGRHSVWATNHALKHVHAASTVHKCQPC